MDGLTLTLNGLETIEAATPKFDEIIASFNGVSTAFNSTVTISDTIENDETEKSIWEKLKKLTEDLKAISLLRHPLDFIKEFAKEAGKSEFSSNLSQISSVLKVIGGLGDIGQGVEKIVNNDVGTTKSVEGILSAIIGVGKIGSAVFKELGEVKMNGAADIVYGGAVYVKAIVRLREGEQKKEKQAASWCKVASGGTRYLAGFCTITGVLAPIGVILGVFSGVCSIAAYCFEEFGIWQGIAVLAVGAVLTGVLIVAMKAKLTTMMSSLTSLAGTTAATLTATIVGAVAGLAILAVIGVMIADAIKSEPILEKANGGFLHTNQPFIAREAGPELVGTLNGRNAVVNNKQIEEAVATGVYCAFRAAMRDRAANTPVRARLYLDGKLIATA